MGTITYSLPVAGQPNSSEDAKVATALQTLLTLVNGHIDANNMGTTGWVSLTLGTNIGGGSSGYTAAARVVGDQVYLRGVLTNNTGGGLGSPTHVATVPAAAIPAGALYLGTTAVDSFLSTTSAVTLYIRPGDGWIQSVGSVPSTEMIALDGLSYSLVT